MSTNLSRRGLIAAAGGAAVAMGSLPNVASGHGRKHGHGKGGDLPLDKIGIQLFTVRDLLADNELDLPGTFEVLRDAGYAEVEIGGTYDGRTAEQFRELAEHYDLEPEGMHNPGGHNAWRDNTEAVLDDAETLGLRYVGVASPNRTLFPSTHESFKRLAEDFNRFGAAARRRGLKFYFHNHPDDFALDGGTPVYNTLLEETDPRLVYFELDIAWVEAGGQSAYQYLRQYGPSRFPLFHVKDLRYADDGPRSTPATVNKPNRRFWLTDVGKGDIDFPKIFSALRDPGDHHYFVEHDDAPQDETPDATSPRPRNPAGSANTAWTSRKYLAELEVPRRRW
jgi:sugar phosphate isomerase/epimerase